MGGQFGGVHRSPLWKLLVLGLALLETSCQTFTGEPTRLYTVAEEAAMARDVDLPSIAANYNAATSDASRMHFRNEYIARRMYIVDLEYTEFQTALTRERQEFGFASALTAQGLSTAGAVFTPASTVRVLSALTSGVNAARGFYDSEILVNKTIQIVESQMQSNRADVATRIFSRVRESTLTYPLSAALIDLEDYYRAGTLTSGLIKATAEAAIDAQQSEALKVAVIRQQALHGIIANVNQPLARQEQLVIVSRTRLTPIEQGLPPARIKQIQTALCVASPTNDLGPLGSDARKALSEFFEGAGLGASQTITSDDMLNSLNRAISKMSVWKNGVRKMGTCASAGFDNARAVGQAVK
jgi:hypothetical protein